MPPLGWICLIWDAYLPVCEYIFKKKFLWTCPNQPPEKYTKRKDRIRKRGEECHQEGLPHVERRKESDSAISGNNKEHCGILKTKDLSWNKLLQTTSSVILNGSIYTNQKCAAGLLRRTHSPRKPIQKLPINYHYSSYRKRKILKSCGVIII